RAEVERLIAAAAGEAEGYTAQEVLLAGEEAGLTPSQMEAAARRIEHEGVRRKSLQASVCAVSVLFGVGLLAPSLTGSRNDKLEIHNRSRGEATVEVRVP